MRILLVEDDVPVASFIRKGLQAESHVVEVVNDGEDAKTWVSEAEFDLLILDVGLPKVDGLEVLKYVRARRPSLPVLMLTARGKVEDRVRGLDLGADDYLAKPFSFSELSARVRALLRRSGRPKQAKLQVADLEVDLADRQVVRAGKRIDLSAREFALLTYLMRNAGRCVSRTMIMEHVWNLSFDTSTNIVDVYINYLRSKIERDFESKLIHTVRGVGYQMNHRSQEK
jgi:DNA-binding response OmpR family regulator